MSKWLSGVLEHDIKKEVDSAKVSNLIMYDKVLVLLSECSHLFAITDAPYKLYWMTQEGVFFSIHNRLEYN